MRDHVKILGILNIVLGSLGALAAVVVLLIFGGVAGIAAFSVHAADYGDSAVAVPILSAVGLCIAGLIAVLSFPAIIGGWGLLHYKSWARILMIIISALDLLHVPLGTALGVYGLWVLLHADTQRLFENGGEYLPVVPSPAVVPPGATPPGVA